MARAAQQQQSLASGTAIGEYVIRQRAFVYYETRKKDRDQCDYVGASRFCLIAPVPPETKAILALESSDSGPQVYESAP
jgi:hypothetical protein